MKQTKEEKRMDRIGQNGNDGLAYQVGGDHYTEMEIQPVEYILANGLGFVEGNVIKYVSRHRSKNGIEDLKKAKHYLEMLISQHEEKPIPEIPGRSSGKDPQEEEKDAFVYTTNWAGCF